MSDMATQAIRVLLIEDSPTDVLMTREALRGSRLAVELDVVEDGVEAMRFLRREGPYKDADRPDLILLDLNLPRKDGREVLEELKQDAERKTIPVVVLTTSKAAEDVRRAYGSHANCYISKPVSFGRFAEVIASIESFWFTVARLPERSMS